MQIIIKWLVDGRRCCHKFFFFRWRCFYYHFFPWWWLFLDHFRLFSFPFILLKTIDWWFHIQFLQFSDFLLRKGNYVVVVQLFTFMTQSIYKWTYWIAFENETVCSISMVWLCFSNKKWLFNSISIFSILIWNSATFHTYIVNESSSCVFSALLNANRMQALYVFASISVYTQHKLESSAKTNRQTSEQNYEAQRTNERSER